MKAHMVVLIVLYNVSLTIKSLDEIQIQMRVTATYFWNIPVRKLVVFDISNFSSINETNAILCINFTGSNTQPVNTVDLEMKCFPVQDCTPKKKGKLIFTFQRSGLLWKCDHCRCAACCLLSRKLVFWPWQVECVNIYEEKCYMSRRVSRNEEELRSTLSHLMSVIKRVCIWLKQFENSLFSARFWRTKEALSFLKFQFETFCPPLSIILRNERTNRPASH